MSLSIIRKWLLQKNKNKNQWRRSGLHLGVQGQGEGQLYAMAERNDG